MHINIFDMNLVKEIKVYDSIVKSPEFEQNHWLDDEDTLFDQIDQQYLINDHMDVCVRLSLNTDKIPC